MKPPSIRPCNIRYSCLAGLLALCMVCAAPIWAQPREVRVGVYANEPKILLGQNGQISGILGELLGEIARRENWRLIAVPCDWQACMELAQNGTIDLLPDVAFSEARALHLDFHQQPSLYSWSQLYSREEAKLQSILDLEDRSIAVLAGSIQQNYLQTLLDSFGLHARLIPVHNLVEGFELVANRQADAVVANQRFGDFHAPHYQLHNTPIMFLPTQLFYATRKGSNSDLLSSIDHHLREWQGASSPSFYHTPPRRVGPGQPGRPAAAGARWRPAAAPPGRRKDPPPEGQRAAPEHHPRQRRSLYLHQGSRAALPVRQPQGLRAVRPAAGAGGGADRRTLLRRRHRGQPA